MSEYELQALIMASRWEFDIPQLLFFVVSLVYIAFGLFRTGQIDRLTVRLLQLSYVFVSIFLLLRTYAAMIRGGKLYDILVKQGFQFEYNNPPVQLTTLFFRVGAVLLLMILALHLLNRAAQPKAA